MTITKLFCPSCGKGYILAPKPPNFFLQGPQVVQNLEIFFFQRMSICTGSELVCVSIRVHACPSRVSFRRVGSLVTRWGARTLRDPL